MSTFEFDLSEGKNEELGKYEPTGEFEKDCNELSAILNIPVTVSHRSKPPSSIVPQQTLPSVKRKVSKRNSITLLHEPVTVLELKENVPATYILSESNEYFKPRILIETEHENNKNYTTELYLRGWLADVRVMSIFAITLPYLERLSVLDMWNTGLTDDTLSYLSKCLNSSPSLITLNLNGNHLVTKQRFDIFLSPDSNLSLQNLSLRSCNITEIGASHLGESLTNNVDLLTLNVCYNNIGDSGLKHLVKALRSNRSLLSLNMGSNGIGDEGVKHIAEALSTFPLTHEQVVARRKMKSLQQADVEAHHKDAVLTSVHLGRRNKAKISTRKVEVSSPKGKREKSNSDVTKNHKGRKPRASPVPVRDESHVHTDVTYSAVYEQVRVVNGELWIAGNRSLKNLNLSRNKITKSGLDLLNFLMSFQVNSMHENTGPSDCGLMRLSLQKNNFSHDDSNYIALCELMKKRDPLYKETSDVLLEEDNVFLD